MGMEKTWHLITLDITRPFEEMASDILFELGAGGVVTLEESAQGLKLGAYFDESEKAEDVAEAVEDQFARVGALSSLRGIALSDVPDQDWMQKWKEGFEPVEIGSRLLIAPSWKLPEDAGGR